MNDFISNYRVELKPTSKIRIYQHLVFLCWYVLVIYSWPYFIPTPIKLALVGFSIVFVIFYIYMFAGEKGQNDNDQFDVFYLSELGHLEWTKSAELGQLQPSSYFWPFCFYLRIENPLTQACYWKIIYTDQLDDDSVRRLRRTIKLIKSQ